MTFSPLKAPFVWFGGKRKVASQVWDALGDVDSYVEPFAGSLAVLLGRPHDLDDGKTRAETVNDADHYLSNFWRALAHDPDAVASFADWPVNEDDLFARHLWLVNQGRSILAAGIEADPDFYDAKIAGWWVWGVNAWIGGGWCSGTGPWIADEEGKRPHLGDAGQGVNRKRPHLVNAGRGVNRKAYRSHGIAAYMGQLADRLRDVRVCTGDWARTVTKGALSFGATVGVFLDPPYSGDVRTKDIYASDDHDISNEVREWCIANGDNPRYRIVLAGYSAEHDHLIPQTWRRVRWSASAAYQTSNSSGGNKDNRHGEVLWCSPHTLNPAARLFEVGAAPLSPSKGAPHE